MKRCTCDRAMPGAGPSTHHGVVHMAGCPHSDLSKTTKPYKRVKVRAIPGVRRLVAIELPEGTELPRRDWRKDRG